MLLTPFLSDLDSRAAVKGSRDPLGIQQIWTRLGRHVVGNLTTVSTSVRDFTTLILGFYFTEQLAEELGAGSELATFLKWEQLAAYSRAVANKDYVFRGTERVQKNLAERAAVYLSDDASHQILGNQKIYGLWGLYTMPARASTLVEGDPSRLTPPARELVESMYLPALEKYTGRDGKRIRDVLRQKISKLDVHKADARLIQGVAHVLRWKLSAKEREFYRFHLLHGGPQDTTGGRQQQLAQLLEETLSQENFTWSPASVAQIVLSAQANGDGWHALAYRLHRIRTSESVLAPVAALFTYLLGLDEKTVKSVAARLKDAWGAGLRTIAVADFRELHAELSAGETGAGDRWIAIAETLALGDYESLLSLLIEQNKSVMAARGGAPWIEVRQDKLHVRFRDEQGALPAQSALPALWRFPYFLDSLRNVADALKEK